MFQDKKKGQNCVSVVVLDEVGLAEDSPSLPLKTLHPLLEDGTTGSNVSNERGIVKYMPIPIFVIMHL